MDAGFGLSMARQACGTSRALLSTRSLAFRTPHCRPCMSARHNHLRRPRPLPERANNTKSRMHTGQTECIPQTAECIPRPTSRLLLSPAGLPPGAARDEPQGHGRQRSSLAHGCTSTGATATRGDGRGGGRHAAADQPAAKGGRAESQVGGGGLGQPAQWAR